MNVADSEIIEMILMKQNFIKVDDINSAEVILFNTCSIRDKAEQSLFKQIEQIKNKKNKIIGILGCMAQRLGKALLEHKNIDFVLGPDEYRTLPKVIEEVYNKKVRIVKTDFVTDEFYDDFSQNYKYGISAFIPIIRGCNNFCTYCVVPYTRGREKSRDIDSIIKEIKSLKDKNYKEITLLGENVDSYSFCKGDKKYNFSDLLKLVAEVDENIRIRFTSSHPKDINKDILETIQKYKNICKHIHLPVQSGSNKILKLMNRPYSREEYLEKIELIRTLIPSCGITTDIMCGFCDENEDDHQQTLDLMEKIKYDSSFTFAYSERSGTYSAKNFKDNVDKDTKIRRLNEIINLQHIHSEYQNKKYIGKTFEILVEGESKRNKNEYFGRTTCNKVVIFENLNNKISSGEFLNVKINNYTSATLFGNII